MEKFFTDHIILHDLRPAYAIYDRTDMGWIRENKIFNSFSCTLKFEESLRFDSFFMASAFADKYSKLTGNEIEVVALT